MYNDCPVLRQLTKGILSRSDLIARRGASFSLFQLIRSLHEDGQTRRGGRDGGKDLKCKTNLGRFKFNTVNDLTAHFATLEAALRFVIFPSLPLFLSLSISLVHMQVHTCAHCIFRGLTPHRICTVFRISTLGHFAD